MSDSPIVAAIHRYHPEWVPPPERNRTWEPCLCPFHADDTPSAAVSYLVNAFICHACGVKGSTIQIIQSQEEVTHREAVRIASELSKGSDATVPPVAPRKSRRRVFGDQGAGVQQPAPRDIPTFSARVRRRPPSWT